MGKTDQAKLNTDKELWREPLPEGESQGMSYYQPSVHVTEWGGIGMSVGGHVFVMPIRDWHNLAVAKYEEKKTPKPSNKKQKDK